MAKSTEIHLDHIVFGVRDLSAGIAMIKDKTGIEAVRGGCHPNRGTCNALFSLGNHQYFEILAPDPDSRTSGSESLASLRDGVVVTWAARTNDIAATMATMTANNIKTTGVTPGSRKTTNGELLQWKTLSADIPGVNNFPFFIDWGNSPHPSINSPAGCRLTSFTLIHPDPPAVQRILDLFNLKVSVGKGTTPGYVLVLNTPKGEVTFS